MPLRIQYPPDDSICQFITTAQQKSNDGYVRFGEIIKEFATYQIKEFSFLRKLKQLANEGRLIHAERIGYRTTLPIPLGTNIEHPLVNLGGSKHDRREECWTGLQKEEELLNKIRANTLISISNSHEWYLSDKFQSDFQQLIDRLLIHCVYTNPDLYQTFHKAQDMEFTITIKANWQNNPEIFDRWNENKALTLKRGFIEDLVPNIHFLYDPTNEDLERRKIIDNLNENHLFNRAFTETMFRKEANKKEQERQKIMKDEVLNLCQREVWENLLAQNESDEQMLSQLNAINELKIKIEQDSFVIPQGKPKIALFQEETGFWKAIVTTQEEDVWMRYVKQYRRKFLQFLQQQRESTNDPFYSLERAKREYEKQDAPKTYKQVISEWEEAQRTKPSRNLKKEQNAIEIRPWGIKDEEELQGLNEDENTQPSIQSWSFWDQRTMEKIFAQQRAMVEKIAEEAENENENQNGSEETNRSKDIEPIKLNHGQEKKKSKKRQSKI